MAYRRSIASRTKFFYQHQHRLSPSISHMPRHDNNCEESRNSEVRNYIQHLFFKNYRRSSKVVLRDRRFAIPARCGRNYSSMSAGGGAPDKNEVLIETVCEAAPMVNEVAVAAADSFAPVAALQYLIDHMHSVGGLEWWAAITAATIAIRLVMLPLIINQIKSASKFALLKPKLESIREEIQNKGMSPIAVAEGQAKRKALFNEYGVNHFTPLKGILISGPVFCSFFFAVRNMAEKVPSFKEGGTLWFTDLTTPDSLYVFPVLTALAFLVTVECNALEGMEGSPVAGTMKKVSRVFAGLTVFLTAGFPKAMFCYWIPSSVFSLAFGFVMKKPQVKKLLGIPIIPVTQTPPPSTAGVSFYESLKKYAEAQVRPQSSAAQHSSKSVMNNAAAATSSVLKQRIKCLEKQLRGRKRGGGKKR